MARGIKWVLFGQIFFSFAFLMACAFERIIIVYGINSKCEINILWLIYFKKININREESKIYKKRNVCIESKVEDQKNINYYSERIEFFFISMSRFWLFVVVDCLKYTLMF